MLRARVKKMLATLAFAAATAFFWGTGEAVVNRYWHPRGTWWGEPFLSSAWARTFFYAVVVAVVLMATGIADYFLRRVRKRPAGDGRRGRRGAVAGAAVLVVNTGWLVAGLDAKSALRLGPIQTNLRNEGPFIIYWVICLVIGAALAVGLKFAFTSRRRWATPARVLRGAGAAAFVALFAGYYGARALRPVPHGPNVVLIVLDAWRADAFRPALTPNLAAYARANAVVYSRAWSAAPWTLPSLAGIFTGQNPDTYRVGPRSRAGVQPTVAELFRAAGYDTAAFVGNTVLERYTPLTMGFEYYRFWDWRSALAAVHFYDTHWYCPALRKTFKMHPPYGPETSRRLTDLSSAYLKQKRRRPFFLYIHYMDPHAPYAPPVGFYRPEDQKYINAPGGRAKAYRDAQYRLYEGEVAYEDTLLAGVLAAVPANAVVVVTGDHGEEFWEHKTYGHGKSVYEKVTRVPLIVAAPGRRPGVDETPVSLLDLAPTFLTAAGLPVPAAMAGRPLGRTGGDEPRFIYVGSEFTCRSDTPGPRQDAVIRWPWKLILTHNRPGEPGEFYNLQDDPGERRPLPEDDVAATLRDRLDAWNRAAGPAASALADADAADLRALGYLQ